MVNSLKPKSLTTICLYITSGLMGGNCLADTIWLTNGDRISGDVIELSNASLKIKTSYADTLSLDISAVQSFHTDAKQPWHINLTPRPVQIYQSERPGYVRVDGKDIAIHDLQLSPSLARWKTSGLLETILDVDNDDHRKEKLHINSELNLESKHWRHELKVEIKHDEEKHQVTEDTKELDYTLDYLFNEHWLLRTDSTYLAEGAGTHNHYVYLGAGPGYRLWGEDENKLDVILSYNHFWIHSGSTEVELDAWGTKLDYTQFWFDKKLEAFADIQISHIYLSELDYIADASAGLRFYLPHHIHLSLKYDYNETKYSTGSIKDSSYVLGAGANF